jgi:hypothetical protein
MDYYTPNPKDLIQAGRALERNDLLEFIKEAFPTPTKQTQQIIDSLIKKGKM